MAFISAASAEDSGQKLLRIVLLHSTSVLAASFASKATETPDSQPLCTKCGKAGVRECVNAVRYEVRLGFLTVAVPWAGFGTSLRVEQQVVRLPMVGRYYERRSR